MKFSKIFEINLSDKFGTNFDLSGLEAVLNYNQDNLSRTIENSTSKVKPDKISNKN